MRIYKLFSLIALLSIAHSIPLRTTDADFLAMRRKLLKDMKGGKASDKKHKYFHESSFHPHYDGRFTDHKLSYVEQKRALKNLAQTFLATFSDLGVETWLVHGSLLGWWWNKQIMPWDSDVDMQVTESSMFYLAAYYNMSVFHYKTPRVPEGRDYMLEVNPHYTNREQTDKMNVIDARWIDTASGLFIDITTARYNLTHPQGEGMMSCKDGHEYRDTYLFPLRDTIFEGMPAKIPFRFKELLAAEYGERSLTKTDFHDHLFNEEKMEWIPKMKQITLEDPRKGQIGAKKERGKKNGQQGNKHISTNSPNGQKVGNPKDQKRPNEVKPGQRESTLVQVKDVQVQAKGETGPGEVALEISRPGAGGETAGEKKPGQESAPRLVRISGISP